VRSKHFQNQARQKWWSVHIEAWQRSGLSRRRYCRSHRLDVGTFSRWLTAIGDAKALQHQTRKKRVLRTSKLSTSKRSVAVQAFWAMHVEALNWSGLATKHYADALRISAISLRRWRDLFDAEEVTIDWRSRLHPSARPQISSGLSSAAKARGHEMRLTDPSSGEPVGDRRSNRRRFTDAEKLSIVQESMVRGANAADICRRHDIVTSMLFRWRAQFGYGREERVRLAAVRAPGAQRDGNAAAVVLQDLLPTPDGMAAVELPDGRRVFAPLGADPEAVRQHVAARETAP